jgi:ribA/ribD-fused uncharacterized protein
MKFWTAQYRYPGPNRLDITVKGKDNLGRFFAPTWEMVKNYKAQKVTDPELLQAVEEKRMTLEYAVEQEYRNKYHEIILNLHYNRPEIIHALLRHEELVLVCFCAADGFCHRNLLAQYLTHYGAEYVEEITDFSPWSKKVSVIDEFRGEYHWLSNFAHCKFTHQGQIYLSVEHFYQAQKASPDEMINVQHPTNEKQKIRVNAREYIATCNNPKKTARKYGIKIPKGWNEGLSTEIMRIGLEYKFIANAYYRKLLIATGDALIIEGNTWHDNTWGNCTCLTNPATTYKKDQCRDPGENRLGKMIMEIRGLIQ